MVKGSTASSASAGGHITRRGLLARALAAITAFAVFWPAAVLAVAQPEPNEADRRATIPGDVPRPVRANFGRERPADDVRAVADWVAASRDHGGTPFLIVDKRNARLLVFDADARLEGSTPILLGAARGDESVPGIGERPIADIEPHERTTPAGRFVAEAGTNLQGEDIVWVDYDAAVSMHRVRANNPRERRHQRLASPAAADNRISYGCINIPAAFYDALVKPVFSRGRRANVYVLPEVRALHDVFPFTPSDLRARSALRPGA